jgi:NAD(P)-dependent dehydrogenase (short-subunit alcohol dehydrogenase family)
MAAGGTALDQAVKTIGGTVSGIQGDVGKLPNLDRLYETVSKVRGRIGVVFASAGVRTWATHSGYHGYALSSRSA